MKGVEDPKQPGYYWARLVFENYDGSLREDPWEIVHLEKERGIISWICRMGTDEDLELSASDRDWAFLQWFGPLVEPLREER